MPRRKNTTTVGMREFKPNDIAASALVVGQAQRLLGFASAFAQAFNIETAPLDVSAGHLLGKELGEARQFVALASVALGVNPDLEAIYNRLLELQQAHVNEERTTA